MHVGAMKAYNAKYQSALSDAEEADTPIEVNAAREIFLKHIKPDAYQQVVMDGQSKKLALFECMERCMRVGVTIEANAASRARKAARDVQDNKEQVTVGWG